jgi:hypothetical protein
LNPEVFCKAPTNLRRRPGERRDPYAVSPMFWLALVALLSGLASP